MSTKIVADKPEKVAETKEVGERTLLINSIEFGVFRITIPKNYTVTFGLQQPGSERNYAQDGTRGSTLRIYDGTASSKKQVCAFPGIAAFRDIALKVEYMELGDAGEPVWNTQDGGEFISSKAFKALKK